MKGEKSHDVPGIHHAPGSHALRTFVCYNIWGKFCNSLPRIAGKRSGWNSTSQQRMNTMNVTFFLIPKQDVAYIFDHFTMRQAMEKMEYHRYTAIPILNQSGEYVGTLTEGDLLWKLKNTPGFDFHKTKDVLLKEIPLQRNVKPIGVQTEMDEIVNLAVDQNFIPVVDDASKFIGIIRRRELIEYMYRKMQQSG